MVWAFLISAVLGYFIGSVNSSIVLSKLKNNDIRQHGSGNAGATNTLRVMGKTAAVLVSLGDALKAVVSILLAWLAAYLLKQGPDIIAYCKYMAALFTVLGHNFPVFFGFKGGKGILTSVAVMFMLDWRIALIVLFVGVMLIVLTRYVSLGSIAGCVLYPLFALAFYSGEPLLYKKMQIVLAVILGILGIWRHKKNIQKLLKGTESKIGEKAKQ